MATPGTCGALAAQLPKMAHLGRALVGSGERGQVLLHLGAIESLGDPSLSALSTHLRLSQSTLSRRLAMLRESNLVQVTPDPADGRRQHVALTDHGRDRLAQCREDVIRRLADRLDDWCDADVMLLVELLERLNTSSLSDCQATNHEPKAS